MDEVMRGIRRMIESGRVYAKNGLLYEAAYRYGQAISMINVLYMLHGQKLVKLDPEDQRALAVLHQKLGTLSASLEHSAGNGKHKMGNTNFDAHESLIRVIGILEEDLESTEWL